MQEESGEPVRGHGDTLVWPCPLCQQERRDREALAQHLTDKHSVLPACLDRLLNTATPVQSVSGAEDSNTHKSTVTDAPASQPTPLEANGEPSEGESSSAGPKQAAAAGGGRVLRSSRLKAALRAPTEPEGEEEREQEGPRDRTEVTKTRKGAARKDKDSVAEAGSTTNSTSKGTGDPALDKFQDLSRPHKCNACLESFVSKTALGVHYSSPAHLQRMRTGSAKPGDEADAPSSSSSASSTAGSQPVLPRPFVSSKPYQCAVCRVSYNHAFTLESHMKSVLHQTRSRSAAGSTSGGSDRKGTASCGAAPAPSPPSVAGSQSDGTTSSAVQGGLSPSSGATKDAESGEAQTMSPAGPAPASVLSLLSSPVASAQALSAFLTLLSSGSHSVGPALQTPLFSTNAPGTPTTPQLELIAQQQLLLPLFLNGLQAQSQGSGLESANTVLAQSVPLLGLSAAQQALLTQRLSSMQNQSSGLLAATEQSEKEQPVDTETLRKEAGDVGEDGQGSSEEGGGGAHASLKPDANRSEGGGEEVPAKAEEEQLEKGPQGVPKIDGTLKTVEDGQCAKGEDSKEETDRRTVLAQLEVKQDAVDEAGGVGEASETADDTREEPSCSASPGLLNKTASLCGEACSTANGTKLCPDATPLSQSSGPFLDQRSSVPNCIGADLKCANNMALSRNERLAADVSHLKGPGFKLGPPILSEFQSQVLWAFLESRSETDAATPPRDDCEALGREVGLSEEVVRRWLGEARRVREWERSNANEVESADKATDGEEEEEEEEEEEGVLTIVETEEGESPSTSSHAMDLSRGGGRGKESPGESCLTSDSDNDGLYTSFIVTDEESQNSSFREESGSPAREEPQKGERESSAGGGGGGAAAAAVVAAAAAGGEGGGGGGKVLRSSTVFLSDAEDTDEEEDSGGQKAKKRKRRREVEEVELKKERLDPDVDLELEAQTDPPPLPAEQHMFPAIAGSARLQHIPLSVSLTPFAAQYLNPYVLSLPPSAIGLAMAEGDGDRDRGRVPTFTGTPTITQCSLSFPESLKAPPLASHVSPVRSLANGGLCESALDLSMGKKHKSTTACASSSAGEKAGVQGDHVLDGHGIRPTALGVPGAGGLIVVRVKPESAVTVPNSNSGVNRNNNNARTSTVYIRAAERISASMVEKERGKEREREADGDKQQKSPKARRFRDMRRSRTIIQTEQLDILYGCYFKDPNPGKHEFERISEWVHLPKKVVQIWFQNMRARERKGEVRFISDGTLAAVGKPLIKFTWPLSLPIFSSRPSTDPSALSSSRSNAPVTRVCATAATPAPLPSVKSDKEQGKEKESGPKEPPPPPSLSHSAAPRTPKAKQETQSQAPAARPAGKGVSASPALPAAAATKTRLPPSSQPVQKRKRSKEGEAGEETKSDEEQEEHGAEKAGPGSTNRMTPKPSSAPAVKPAASDSHKRNGLSDWSPKSPFKINTLSREQLGLSSSRPSVATAAASSSPSNTSTSTTPASPAPKPSPGDGGSYLQHSTPRRPRTHLTSLQVSIMQSCYEMCPHPNALECETVGTELGLPLKVVQIWFQNTRAKEKRWRLQLQKQSPNTESSKKVDTSSGSFLLYNALRANRPILPKPVQLTVLEPSAPPGLGQPAGRETLRGRCDACAMEFESRAAGRSHVFSPRHLATLRSTNFGQPTTLVNKASGAGSSAGSGPAVQSSPPNPASTTS